MYPSSSNASNDQNSSSPNPHQHRPVASNSKEPSLVVGIPSVEVVDNRLVHGDSQSSSVRSYTSIKLVGDGSFGTVWLVDWHGSLPPDTPLSPMQCGAGARPEWTGKRLVALKRMKKTWDGGWDECRKLKELESLRAIPPHRNIIPLYDFFLLPSTKELYFVFESMEGNLYQLIKSRKGRPLAGGLVSSIFFQVVAGLDHIHSSGYFHRDMKPENLLVTTTGLFDYHPVLPTAPLGAPTEKDVVVIVKLADFGLARETQSKPPYTEYVSTRWYRAPEVLLRSRDYSSPVDMWALGTIMAELVNLRPLFPGYREIDQVARICEVLGDPSDEYGVDARGSSIGGGKWVRGIRMARSVGFTFPKLKPVLIHTLFDRSTPSSLIECISDLLKYDPDVRLTSRQCLEHRYLAETTPRNTPPTPQHLAAALPKPSAPRTTLSASNSVHSLPRSLPPHSHSSHLPKPPFPCQLNGHHLPHLVVPSMGDHFSQHRAPSLQQNHSSSSVPSSTPTVSSDILESPADYDRPFINDNAMRNLTDSSILTSATSNGWVENPHSDWEPMDISSPQSEIPLEPTCQPMDVQVAPIVPEVHHKPVVPSNLPEPVPTQRPPQPSQTVAHKLRLGSLGFGKKHSKWGLSGMFGHGDKSQQNVLPPVDEVNVPSSNSTPSLKRTQTSSTDSRSLCEPSHVHEPQAPMNPADAKRLKKEAERIAHEAELARRALAKQRNREQARAVIQKRNQILQQGNQGTDLVWEGAGKPQQPKPKPKPRQGQVPATSSATVNAAGGRFRGTSEMPANTADESHWREPDYRTKARRRDWDDDHSMSSSEVQSAGRLSVISFATADSDPGPGRLRHRPSLFGINRMQSNSSLRTSFGEEFPGSGRSSRSLSLEQQLVNDFSHASFSALEPVRSPLSETSSPPMQMLSLSCSQQSNRRLGQTTMFTLPPPISTLHNQHLQPPGPSSPFEYGQNGHIQAHPPSPGIAPYSAINPMFKVPSLSSNIDHEHNSSPHLLPPFSHLASVAEHCPPLSPMSLHSPLNSQDC